MSCNTNGTCQMFLAIQWTWDDIPRERELLTHSPSHDANDEVVLMGHSHHIAVTLAGEPFPVHLLVPLVSHFSWHLWLLLATLYHWGHPSALGATEMKYKAQEFVVICVGLKEEPSTMCSEIGMLSTSRSASFSYALLIDKSNTYQKSYTSADICMCIQDEHLGK